MLVLVDNIEMKGEISADNCMNRKVKVRIIKFHFQIFILQEVLLYDAGVGEKWHRLRGLMHLVER